jgi:hypothetical protein
MGILYLCSEQGGEHEVHEKSTKILYDQKNSQISV